MKNLKLPAELAADQQSHDIIFWDEANPRSLVSILPDLYATKLKDMKFEHPDYFGLEERDLAKLIREKKSLRPSPTVNRIRLKVWQEYDNAQMNQTKMDSKKFYAGICDMETFDGIIRYAHNLAWIFCPPANYMTMMEEGLLFGIERLRDILELPVEMPGGQINSRLAELQAKIVMMFDERVKGAVPKHLKIDQETKNLHLHATEKGVKTKLEELSEQELQRTLENLRKREKKQEKIIDAEVTKVE